MSPRQLQLKCLPTFELELELEHRRALLPCYLTAATIESIEFELRSRRPREGVGPFESGDHVSIQHDPSGSPSS